MKSTFDTLFKSDDKKSIEGIPVIVGHNQKGGKVTMWVAETGNPNHEKIQRKFARAYEKARANSKQRSAITCEIVAESILIKWEGVLDAKGKALPPTKDNKVDALMQYDKLLLEILDVANDPSNFSSDPESEKATEKN